MSRRVAVHPNSTAARKWGRKLWTSTLDERDARRPRGLAARRSSTTDVRLFAAAHRARLEGDHERAQALTRAAMRTRTTSLNCG